MKQDLTWVATKLKQLLDTSPYIFDYSEYVSNDDKPTLVYKDFLISVDGEDRITLGVQPTLNRENKDKLVDKLEMMVDKVNVKHL